MKEILYLLIDIANYLMHGILLVLFLKPVQKRFCFKIRNMTEILLIAQYVAVQMFLHTSETIKVMLYGKDMLMTDSRQSILLVLISLCITYFVSIGLLEESRLKVFYYVVTFYSILELVRFAFYIVSLKVFDWIVNLNMHLYVDKNAYGTEVFYRIASGTEVLWNVLLLSAVLFAAYKIMKQIKKHLLPEDEYQKSELIFLLLPSGIGLLVCFMIRSVMFSMEGVEMKLLFDTHPEMNLCIPLISVLCIAMIIFGARMLEKLFMESKRKIEVSIYQNRLKEMEQHIGDIEELYAGIRGMKHDMKNYIADMDALMKNTKDLTKQTDLKKYLSSLQASVEQLDMKCNTGNPVTDVIIQRYIQLTNKMNIAFRVDFIFPVNMYIDAFDLSIIMNNALDNAVEACLKKKESDRYIEITAYRRENMFFMIIRNSFDGKIVRNHTNGYLLTTKADVKNHGLGLRNIELCAEKYYGKAETTAKDGVFELAVMLQKREEAGNME